MALSQSGRGSENECHRILFLALSCSAFSPVLWMKVQEVCFVSLVVGTEVGGVACLVDKSRFRIIQNEGPN